MLILPPPLVVPVAGRIAAQAEAIGHSYPVGMTVGAMRRAGFVVDAFIPPEAVYTQQRAEHVVRRRSAYAAEGYVFEWTERTSGGALSDLADELARELDRDILTTLLEKSLKGTP